MKRVREDPCKNCFVMPACSKVCDRKEIIDNDNKIVYGTTIEFTRKAFSDIKEALYKPKYMVVKDMIGESISVPNLIYLEKGWKYKRVGM